MRPRALVALLLSMLVALPWAIKQIAVPGEADFLVYYTAASLVTEHKSPLIYDQADNGMDPQLRFAPKDSAFAQAAMRKGIAGVRLYLYPPTLADALTPLAALSRSRACDAWLAVNVACVLLTALLLIALLNKPLLSLSSLVLTAALLLFRASIWGVYHGQISLVLLALWAGGTVLFYRGWLRVSALLFAVAATIKLTPLLVVVPFLLWRQWKWLGWFALSLGAILAATLLINGPATLLDYVRHVLPAMSNGVVHPQNVSLPAAISTLYAALTGQDLSKAFVSFEGSAVTFVIPHWLTLSARFLSAVLLCLVMFGIYRKGEMRPMDRVKVLFVLSLLSQCIAPVAWRHAYAYACLPLTVLWWEALHEPRTDLELGFLAFCTVEFGFVFDSVVSRFSNNLTLALTSFFVPLTALALIAYTLRKIPMSLERQTTA